jgi:hypothetical protein
LLEGPRTTAHGRPKSAPSRNPTWRRSPHTRGGNRRSTRFEEFDDLADVEAAW